MNQKARFLRGLLVVISLLALNTGCKKICGDAIPQYTLSAGQRAWSDSFATNAVWRFRNAATGYERVYRVTRLETQNIGSGGATKTSVCPTYYVEYITADLERTDSIETSKRFYRLSLYANDSPSGTGFRASLDWAPSASFDLPIDEVEDGRRQLPPATFSGRTYPAVLECTYNTAAPNPATITRLYLTKTEGVVRLEERGGSIWNRL